MRPKKIAKLIAWIASFEIIGFLLGLLTQANLYPWYDSLNKSYLTPPGIIFSIVWSFLYLLLAVIGWALSKDHNELRGRGAYSLYKIQMLMNWAWTPLFFGLHWIKFSALWLVTLTTLNLILFIKIKDHQKIIASLLLIYIGWLIFASYLNGVIAFSN